ncbi:MAG: phosphate-starvation-inducible E-like protein [Chloroflexi bacterium]|nr:phosphate-starvation-inducible E-like protein [Chloroflexota bacterium]
MTRLLRIVERIIVTALIVMMTVVLLLTTVDLGWLLIQDILTAPILLLDVEELLDIFGFFLLVLIGVELLETIKAYFDDHVVHVEVVLEVAMIAIARKVITLEVKDLPSLTLLGISAIILALAVAFYFVKRTMTPHAK